MTEGKPTILLVEEDKTMSEVTSYRLGLLGYEVTAVESTKAAFEHLAATASDPASDEVVDVIVTDLSLSGMSGFDFIEQLASDESTTDIPVMVLSADAELDTVQKAFRSGAIEYLVTPYNPLVLETKIEKLIGMVGKAV